ncbi:hypothetical protein [Halegenticoccus soli]|uniref:hypothetical protein n=1 Tax=Halegenticoccus soli TaxID=1985678 RepID=UPI0018EE20A2|nr:hypothetical protein [Halegenticoccus soli]
MNESNHILATNDADDGGPISGRCDHCDWRTTTDSYAAMVRAYHDHLRAEHPEAWLRA